MLLNILDILMHHIYFFESLVPTSNMKMHTKLYIHVFI